MSLEIVKLAEKFSFIIWRQSSTLKITKYAFHWQDENKNLLVRWDNAPDWDVKTFPHHKHEINEKSISASYERTLEQVFDYISKKLAS